MWSRNIEYSTQLSITSKWNWVIFTELLFKYKWILNSATKRTTILNFEPIFWDVFCHFFFFLPKKSVYRGDVIWDSIIKSAFDWSYDQFDSNWVEPLMAAFYFLFSNTKLNKWQLWLHSTTVWAAPATQIINTI